MMKHRAFGEAPQVPVASGVTLTIGVDGIALLGGTPIGGTPAAGRAKFRFFSVEVTSGPADATITWAFPIQGGGTTSSVTGASSGVEYHGCQSWTATAGDVIAYLFT